MTILSLVYKTQGGSASNLTTGVGGEYKAAGRHPLLSFTILLFFWVYTANRIRMLATSERRNRGLANHLYF